MKALIAAVLGIFGYLSLSFIGPVAIVYGNEQKIIFGAIICSIMVVLATAILWFLATGLETKKAKTISIGLLLLAITGFAASLIAGFNCDSQRYLSWAAALAGYITFIHPFIFLKMAV